MKTHHTLVTPNGITEYQCVHTTLI